MKKITNYELRITNDTHGYAILFTMVIVGIILAIATGMSNSVYKEMLLTSTARESQIAFYQADTATECGVYAEHVVGLTNIVPSGSTTGSWSCGGAILSVVPPSGTSAKYNFSPTTILSGPCFNIDITLPAVLSGATTVEAYGYNTCNKNDPRQVERGVKLEY